MSNPSKYIALVAQCFLDDDVLAPMVGYQIISGFRRTLADDYLDPIKNPTECCIGIRTLNLMKKSLGGSEYHGMSKWDQLIEISITHKCDNDTYVSAIVDEIGRILTKRLSKTIGGITYSVLPDANISFTPVNDPAFSDRIELTSTCRLKYLYT